LKKQDILQFWRSVEIFDLPDFNDDAVLLKSGEPLPWLIKERPVRTYYKWNYTVIFGKIEKKTILDHINTLLKAEPPNDWEEPVHGFSCLSALILDQNGRPQQDSYVAASYSHGIRLLEKKQNLSSVTLEIEKSAEDYLERYNIPLHLTEEEQSLKGDVVYWEQLQRELDYLNRENRWWKKDIKIFVLEEQVPKDSETNVGFMNSFYLDDLNHLTSIKEKYLGKALQTYLALQPPEKRVDIIRNKAAFFNTFDPELMTAGRWPSNIEYGLYAAQEGAVNTTFSVLRNEEGLQGINGPPGTGKTTLLLDIIAEIIVERAKVIAELGCDRIFDRNGYTKVEKESGFNLHTYAPAVALRKDFGIVVASNNNAAVENISKELPLKSKIDGNAFPEADYFSVCSGAIIEEESWGVLAAALGNAKNRNTFRKAFWQSDKERLGFDDLLYNVYRDPATDKAPIHQKLFEEQQVIFQSLLAEFDAFRKTAACFHQQLPAYMQNKQKEKQTHDELKQISVQLGELSVQRETLTSKEHSLTKDAERVQSLLHLHIQRRPSFFFFQKLFKTARFKTWNTEAEEIHHSLKNINVDLDYIKKSLNDNERDIQTLLSKQKKAEDALSLMAGFFEKYQKLQDVLTGQYKINGKNLFDINFFQKEMGDVHLLNPYHSDKTAKLRSDLFLSALELHRHAILFNAKKIRNNLKAWFEMTAGWVKVDGTISQNLWDTFFLCVPVVSTTLASASRLFPNMMQQQIGWLLLDEAGQATPQSAVGLIHRSKRCIIVGDPLQVEPVVTIPEKLVAKLREEYKVPVEWSPYKVSVQQLADRVSVWGTSMPVGNTDEEIWTGFSLRTHRRCDDPMFSISNKIAYSNQMVKAVKSNSQEAYIGPSAWFDVSAPTTMIGKHVVKEEITVLAQKISELRNTGYRGNIYIISPFKSVAFYCNEQFRNQQNISCGTIHRFQGKEADIVFLVLGSDPKFNGARNWASQKPNMLNVALTRAKKRFYVIGNKRLWASCNYFNTMASGLGG
jgi:hypothetical protein